MYQNYIFDFYGTLADIRTDEEKPWLWEKMSEIYSAMGAVYSPKELKSAFRSLEKQVREEPQTGETTDANAVTGTERMSNAENMEPDLRKVFSLLYERKGVMCEESLARLTGITFRALSRKYLRVYDGVKGLLEELRRRGKGVYLLSNAQTDFTRPEIEMLGLTSYFNGIFISSEQGCKKPSPVFFESLLKYYDLNPQECIMIGNDEEADIAGANQVGMDSLYIHTAISPREYGKVKATYRVMDGDFRKIRDLVLRKEE